LKPSNYMASLNCAVSGILHAAKTQKHMRNHFLAALGILLAALLLRVSCLEFILLAISISFVLFAELLNTAIEICVDMISPGYHPLAKAAKDVAAGAVLMAAVGAAIMGYLVLFKYLFPLYGEALGMIGTPKELGSLIAILCVIILVVILKSVYGKGTPFEGGSVSGHAAVAFSIATMVSISTRDPISSILTILLAVMVGNSRITLKVHTMGEVIFGALTGTVTTIAVLLIFMYMR
jgi:diacylglycerol kinase (ATP)